MTPGPNHFFQSLLSQTQGLHLACSAATSSLPKQSSQCFCLKSQEFSQQGLLLSHQSGHWASPIWAAVLFPKPRPDPVARIPSMVHIQNIGPYMHRTKPVHPAISRTSHCSCPQSDGREVLLGGSFHSWTPPPAAEAHAPLPEGEEAGPCCGTQHPDRWAPG